MRFGVLRVDPYGLLVSCLCFCIASESIICKPQVAVSFGIMRVDPYGLFIGFDCLLVKAEVFIGNA